MNAEKQWVLQRAVHVTLDARDKPGHDNGVLGAL